jgi:hypothetical protein
MRNFTRHFETRLQQRGYRYRDVELVMESATETPDGLFLRRKDVDQEVERLIRERNVIRLQNCSVNTEAEQQLQTRIERLMRLSGTFVPESGGRLLSIYRPCRRREKRELRGARFGHGRPRRRRVWR